MINSTGVGTVTSEMVLKRAVELAVIDGRRANDVSKSDLRMAKRELTGVRDLDPDQTALESLPESERWDPLPGSTGHVVPATSTDEEDGEGRSIGEILVEEGVEEADHDQRLKIAQANEKADQNP